MLIKCLAGEQNKQVLPSPNQLPCPLPTEHLFPCHCLPSSPPPSSPLSLHTHTHILSHTHTPARATLAQTPIEHQCTQMAMSVCVQSKQVGVALGPEEEVTEVGIEAAPHTKWHSSDTGLAVVETKLFHFWVFLGGFHLLGRPGGHSSWFWQANTLALHSPTMARYCPVVPSRQ